MCGESVLLLALHQGPELRWCATSSHCICLCQFQTFACDRKETEERKRAVLWSSSSGVQTVFLGKWTKLGSNWNVRFKGTKLSQERVQVFCRTCQGDYILILSLAFSQESIGKEEIKSSTHYPTPCSHTSPAFWSPSWQFSPLPSIPLLLLVFLSIFIFLYFASFLSFSICLSDLISFCAGCGFRTRPFASYLTSRMGIFAIRNCHALTFTSNLLRAHSFEAAWATRSPPPCYFTPLLEAFCSMCPTRDEIFPSKLPSKGFKMWPFAEFTSENWASWFVNWDGAAVSALQN